MNDRTQIRTGIVGAAIAGICCATPLLVVLLPALGLGAWLAGADYVLFPLLFAFLGLAALGFYRRRIAGGAVCATKTAPGA